MKKVRDAKTGQDVDEPDDPPDSAPIGPRRAYARINIIVMLDRLGKLEELEKFLDKATPRERQMWYAAPALYSDETFFLQIMGALKVDPTTF